MADKQKTRIPESHLDLPGNTTLAHITTVVPRDKPQSSPVWSGWDGEYVKFSQTKTRQKYKAIYRERRLALSIVYPGNPLRYLEVRGVVDRNFINSMSEQHLGGDRYPNHRPGDERVVVFVRLEHTTKKDG